MTEAPVWRIARAADVDAMMAIQAVVHTLLPERREVLVDKMQACPEGCCMLAKQGKLVGYGVAHPWTLDDIPALDARLKPLGSEPGCLFIHDVAILEEARGRGAARAFVERAAAVSARCGLARLALVSVYGTVPVWSRLGFRIRGVAGLTDKFEAYGPTARYMTADV